MTDHPENTPMNRFFAFWWGLGGILVFGVFALIVAGAGSAGKDGANEFEANRAAQRWEKLGAVLELQGKLLSSNGEAVDGAAGKIRIPVEAAAEMAVKKAGKGVPRVTAVPVPGTPAALELMKKQAAEQAAAKKEEPAQDASPESAKKPASSAVPPNETKENKKKNSGDPKADAKAGATGGAKGGAKGGLKGGAKKAPAAGPKKEGEAPKPTAPKSE